MTDVSSDSTLSVGAGGFDRFGVPQTADAAYSMTPEQIRDAVLKVVAFNDGCDVDELPSILKPAEDGSLALDSVQAVFAASAFSNGFGTKKKLVNLSKIAQKNWATTETVTKLLTDLIDKRRAGA